MKNLVLCLIALSIISCKKNENSDISMYLKYEINGVQKSFTNNEYPPNFTNGTSSNGYDSSNTVNLKYISICEYSNLGSFPSFEIVFITFSNKELVDSGTSKFKDFTDFKNIFTIGKKEILRNANLSNQKGIKIVLYDENKTTWSTSIIDFDSLKPINPNYNDFNYEILSSNEVVSPENKKGILVKSQFNATLYNQNGDSLVVEKGEIQTVYFDDI